MKTNVKLAALIAASAIGMVLAGCGVQEDGGAGTASKSALSGDWLSDGNNVAPLLAGAPFNYVKITASFHDDGTYQVMGLDKSNKSVEFDGTFQADASSVDGIYTITVNQTAPTSTLAQGIFSIDTTVDPAVMQYEVVQTQPTNGLTPPTAEKGFGSTVFNGKQIATLIQKFVRQ